MTTDVRGLGEDVGLVQLRAGGAERPVEQVRGRRLGGGARVGARECAGLCQAFERGLPVLGEARRTERAALRGIGGAAAGGGRRGCCGLRADQCVERVAAARGGGAMAGGVQRRPERAGDQRAHAPRVAEAHLGFARMHVDVDLARGKVHEQRQQGIAALRQQVAVGRAHGADQQAVLDRAAVDEQVLLAGIGPVQGGKAGKARDAHAFALDVDGKRIVEEVAAHDAAEAGEVAVGPERLRGELEADALAGGQGEAHLRVRHGEALDHFG